MGTRVNTSAINAFTSGATNFTTTFGDDVSVGDLIVVTIGGNGTHSSNGYAVADDINGTYTDITDVQFGSGVSKYNQMSYMVATAPTASTTTITFTPVASASQTTAVVDVFRGYSGTISRTAVTSSNAAGTSPSQAALASAPTAGDLVVAGIETNGGAFTNPPTNYTTGSTRTGGQPNAAQAYVLSANGSSTYGGNWTISASNASATIGVAFAAATLASNPAFRPNRNKGLIMRDRARR